MKISEIYDYLSSPIEGEIPYDWNDIPVVTYDPNYKKKFSGKKNKYTKTNNTFARNTNLKQNWRESRYAKIFQKENQTNDDKLLDKIKDNLNKLTRSNFTTNIDGIKTYLNDISDEYISKFVQEVFNRASCQDIFCEMYVDALKCISSSKQSIIPCISTIIEDYLSLFDTKITKKEIDDYDEFCKNNKEKKFRAGYSSFISELYRCDMIPRQIVVSFANTILKNITNDLKKDTNPDIKENIQDNVECFKKLVNRIHSNSSKQSYNEMKQHIQNILSLGRKTLKEKMGFKSIFSLEDVSKMLSNQ
jgi:hypothetical protein